MEPYIAHSSPDGVREPQTLQAHLTEVAALAEGFFTHPFLREAARLSGLYHDAGKYQPDVQRHIRQHTPEKIDHASLGAQLLAMRAQTPLAFLAAAPIMGHHGGIPDCVGKSEGMRSVEARLANPIQQEARLAFEQEMGVQAVAYPTVKTLPMRSSQTCRMELYLAARMLHSALTDADALDTERYYHPERAETRGTFPPLSALQDRYETYMEGFTVQKPIDAERAQIREQCLRAAALPQGLFTLTVPTGGGKTLSSLGFALRHAATWKNIRRVIYAIPFTSIVEQNAAVFRQAVGEDAVLEHHSAVNPPDEYSLSHLATENWDAPLIVTTNVQLFQSLFDNRPSASRKLHRLQDSVIILDEAQALPDAYLRPCLNMLDALVKNYRATVVLCSATQPGYGGIWRQPPPMREMIDDPRALFERLRRTRAQDLGMLDDAALLDCLQTHPQVLCVVNNRAQAQELHAALGGEEKGAYHLSTAMCAQHRTQKLNWIRGQLQAGHLCRVISTSLIEAGVDVDFPVVYRAMAGLDSIVQAAGRCNRNGLAKELATVYLFTPAARKAPAQTERLAKITAMQVAPAFPDLLGQEALEAYFAHRFGSESNLDVKRIMAEIEEHNKVDYPYATIAERFRMIESGGEPVFIPYDAQARALIATLRETGVTGGLLRRLQRYGVTLYPNQMQELARGGCLTDCDGLRVLDVADAQLPLLYSEAYGLKVSDALALLVT